MVGDAEDGREDRRQGGSGHRATPRYPRDVRVVAWAADRERCLAEAVAGLVECFADVYGVRATEVDRVRLAGRTDDDLLATLLDEVIDRVEEDGRVPVDVEAEEDTDGGLDIRLAVARLDDVEITGAPPRGVVRRDLRIGPDAYGWSCVVILDADAA